MRGEPTKHLALKASEACIHETHEATVNKEVAINRQEHSAAITSRLSAEGAGKNLSLSQSFPKGVHLRSLKAAACGSAFELSMHLGADCNPL